MLKQAGFQVRRGHHIRDDGSEPSAHPLRSPVPTPPCMPGVIDHQVLKSYVGGDEFWSLCWIMHCGVSDLPASMLGRALRETGKDYSQTAYMLSAQLARKPVATAL